MHASGFSYGHCFQDTIIPGWLAPTVCIPHQGVGNSSPVHLAFKYFLPVLRCWQILVNFMVIDYMEDTKLSSSLSLQGQLHRERKASVHLLELYNHGTVGKHAVPLPTTIYFFYCNTAVVQPQFNLIIKT